MLSQHINLHLHSTLRSKALHSMELLIISLLLSNMALQLVHRINHHQITTLLRIMGDMVEVMVEHRHQLFKINNGTTLPLLFQEVYHHINKTTSSNDQCLMVTIVIMVKIGGSLRLQANIHSSKHHTQNALLKFPNRGPNRKLPIVLVITRKLKDLKDLQR
jgi:hypothetical protein